MEPKKFSDPYLIALKDLLRHGGIQLESPQLKVLARLNDAIRRQQPDEVLRERTKLWGILSANQKAAVRQHEQYLPKGSKSSNSKKRPIFFSEFHQGIHALPENQRTGLRSLLRRVR